MSDFLRNAMQRAASSDPPVADAWTRFQGRRTRSQRARGAAVFVSSLVAAVALVVVLPGGGGPNTFPGGGRGSEDPTPQDPALKRYLEPEVGYQIRFPADWFARGVKGQYAELFPPQDGLNETSALSSIDERDADGRTVRIEHPRGFFIEITPTVLAPRTSRAPSDVRGELMDELDAAGAAVSRSRVRVGGRQAVTYGVVFPEEPQGRTPSYWCSACRMAEYHLDAWKRGLAVSIRMIAPDASTFERYLPHALQMVSSFAAYTTPDPEDSPVRL